MSDKPRFAPADWFVQMPFDSSDYLDRGPVTYEDDEDLALGADPPSDDDFYE